MTMITQLQSSLMQHKTRFDVLNHTASMTTREAARRAGVPPQQMAKPVILDDFQGHWMMAVVPASRHVDLEKVHKLTHRHWRLVRERDFGKRFANCETGAIPAVGNLFGLDTLIDQSLAEQPDIYFESGRHDELVHMSGKQYMALMPEAKSGKLCE
ncbi:YbaK/EbsC family protein [Pseudomonas sp. BN414]|uniref:aminoacyl-tRNA deacylase n=1 Tax=Pseudomonadaceae TaxID=135621 RepID=UPI00098496F9|nr:MULTISPECIES: YbaK/EbsC family protein [Pseudomonas]MDH4570033.1 YbaK/EbsC family protein [Pseudomonas sp. BN414]NWL77536.1 deacylase [Pseudomonas taiwanensis]GLZ85424.1 deacylase [Pseudomonas resinovorans]